MITLSGKKYWIVGASEGLGRALAQQLAAAGAEVVVSARNAERLKALCEEIGPQASWATIDVTDAKSVEAAAKEIGRIDGMVYLAGVYWPMRSQDWDSAKIETMCDINYTGGARVIGAILPEMVARDAGHIVLIGSLSGFRGVPGAIGYAPSKAGLMALGECMYADLRQTGVQVQVINPGYVATRLTEKNDFTMPFIMEPRQAADEIIFGMRAGKFKYSFPKIFSLFFRGTQFLPDWLHYRIFS
ncbi:MAG: SDR family NAD(P)-dependent oxidoreductase [Pseudomonadota bacterium]